MATTTFSQRVSFRCRGSKWFLSIFIYCGQYMKNMKNFSECGKYSQKWHFSYSVKCVFIYCRPTLAAGRREAERRKREEKRRAARREARSRDGGEREGGGGGRKARKKREKIKTESFMFSYTVKYFSYSFSYTVDWISYTVRSQKYGFIWHFHILWDWFSYSVENRFHIL